MKLSRIRFLTLLTISLLGACAVLQAAPPSGYSLVWSDEFGGSSMDTNKWGYRSLGARRRAINVEEAVTVSNGYLHITTSEVSNEYHTGMIGTGGKYETTYGYFECSLEIHEEEGQWGAFWLQSPTIGNPLGNPGVAGTEIDIAECHAPWGDKFQQALHWDGYGDDHQYSTHTVDPAPGISSGFHVYGLEWTSNGYVFYLDGTQTWSTSTALSHRDEYMILSMEVDNWVGNIDNATLPDGIRVDYVRVYKEGTSTNQPPTADAGPAQSVTDLNTNGSENVTLDGSASTDADGSITNYSWTLGGSPIATGATPTVSLNLGTNLITLTVADDDGATDADTVTITVSVAPVGPPAGATVTSLFQKGVSPDAGYSNMLDSTMRQLTGDSYARNALGKDPAIDLRYNEYYGTLCMWFDVSSIPTNATIESATLKIWHNANEFDASGNLEVYRLDDPSSTGMWIENDDASSFTEVDKGCSRYKRPDVAWNSSGGRVYNVISETNKVLVAHTGLADEWLAADVTTDMELFVADPAVNLGWMIQSSSDNTLRGDTYMSDNSTTSKRPILEVVYSTVSPSNMAPTAVATATPTNGFDPLMVDFDASGSSDSDGTITNFAWDFGDGNNSTSVSPSHSYSSAGVYTSVVTVTDDDGDMDSASVVITVNSSLTDSDGDGHTDAEESIAGTNPNDPQDNLWLTYLAVASGVQWNGVTGRMYDVEKSTQLGTSWEPLAGYQDIAGAGSVLAISNVTFDSEIYLRIKVRQP